MRAALIKFELLVNVALNLAQTNYESERGNACTCIEEYGMFLKFHALTIMLYVYVTVQVLGLGKPVV